MHRRILTLGILLLASFLVFGDWMYDDFTIAIPEDGFSASSAGFGIADGATDLYDSDLDASHPPCPPSAPCVYFPSDDPLITMLERDVRGTVDPGDSVIWKIVISGGSAAADFTWESDSLPAGGDFKVTSLYPGMPADWSAATDMRTSAAHEVMMAQQIHILYVSPTEVPEDTDPPIVTAMDPVDGATDVSPMATISFDLVDVGSEATVDEASVTISIDGMPVPSPTSYATTISGGYRFAISPSMIPMMSEWPTGDHAITINACDPVPNCMSEFEYNFTVADVPVEYEISGTVELVGETDHSGVEVTMTPGDGSVTTGTDGAWSFVPTEAGNYSISASKDGFITPAPLEISLSEGSPTSTGNIITMNPEGPDEVSLFGTVNLSDSPVDLSGSVVAVDGYGEATTLVDGGYEITGLPVDTELDITVSRTGYVSYETSMRLTTDTEQDFELDPEAGPTYTVSGIFTLEGASDYAGTTVELTGESAITTIGDGSYEFTDIEAGDYTITASRTGYATYTEDFSVVDENVIISSELAEESVTLGRPSGTNASETYLYWIVVRWDEPLDDGLHEIFYDDGVADDAGGGFTHIGIGGDPTWEMGVEFTPPEDDCTLLSVRYNFLINCTGGTPTMDFRVREMVADTPADELIPGPVYEELDTSLDWNVVEIAGGLPLEDDDDFFCGFRDVVIGTDTTALYIGCDKTDSDERSWLYQPTGGWGLVSGYASPATINLSDFMIRAMVQLPDGSLCELAPEGTGIAPRFFPPSRTRFDEAPKAAIIDPAKANPFTGSMLVNRDFASYTESLRRDFAPMEAHEVLNYNVYRSTSPFDAIDDPGVELVATMPAESLVYYDNFADSTVTIEAFEWVWYGITAVYAEGESELGVLDSGYYQDFFPDAQILLVDLSGGTDIASGGTESEPDFLYRTLTDDLGISEDSIYQTQIGEGLGRAVLEFYDLVIIVSGMMEGTQIDISGGAWEDLKAYIDGGGNVYYEGCVTPLRYFYEAGFEDFDDYFGFETSYPDSYYSHSSDSGNVLWCETTSDFQTATGGSYLQMDYLTYTVADFRVAELEPIAPFAKGWFRSQDDSPTIPIPFSRNRMVYHMHDSSSTIYSSVYVGSFMDEDAPSTRSYLLGKMLWGAYDIMNDAVKEEAAALPTVVMLESNSPNPFNGATRIDFSLPQSTVAKLEIFDVTGTSIRTLVDGAMMRGAHSATWDAKDDNGNDVPTGVYFYKLTTKLGEETKQMLYMK